MSVEHPYETIADAIREAGRIITGQLRESLGPRVEVQSVSDPNALLETIRPLLVEMTPEEMADPLTVKAKLHHELKRRVQNALLVLCGFEESAETTADGSANNDLAHDRAAAIMTFLGLAARHSLPDKLLPRGDRTGDWLPPGTEVTVLGQHPAVVMPTRDMVTVKLEGSDVVTEFPRMSITKRGEPWTPAKRTTS